MTLAPPAPPVPLLDGAPPAASRPIARVIAVVLVALGVVAGLGVGAVSFLGTARDLSRATSQRSADVAGVTRLQIETGATDLTVSFADVPRAELEVTGDHGAERWTVDRQGSALVIASPSDLGRGFLGSSDTATLRLPASLAGLVARLTMGAGDLTVDGTFRSLDLDIGAGDASVTATVDALTLRLGAGDAHVSTVNADTVSFAVSGGDLVADLGGGQPRTLSVAATAADVRVALAPGRYRLTGDAADSDLVDTGLSSDPAATSTIDAHVSVSDVVISAAR